MVKKRCPKWRDLLVGTLLLENMRLGIKRAVEQHAAVNVELKTNRKPLSDPRTGSRYNHFLLPLTSAVVLLLATQSSYIHAKLRLQ